MVHGTTSGGNQAQACKTALPMKSHRMYLIPPATSYDNTNQISTREAEVQSSGFLLQAGHITTLSLEHTNISESQKENRSQHKSHSLYKQVRHKEALLSFKESVQVGVPPKVQVPGIQPRVVLASRLFQEEQSQAFLY